VVCRKLPLHSLRRNCFSFRDAIGDKNFFCRTISFHELCPTCINVVALEASFDKQVKFVTRLSAQHGSRDLCTHGSDVGKQLQFWTCVRVGKQHHCTLCAFWPFSTVPSRHTQSCSHYESCAKPSFWVYLQLMTSVRNTIMFWKSLSRSGNPDYNIYIALTSPTGSTDVGRGSKRPFFT